MQATAPNPWYKEPWPFILISITGLGVVAGSTLAYIGLSNPPEIVSGQFDSLGKFLTEDTSRAAEARALGLSGRLGVDGDAIKLSLSAGDLASLPGELMVQFQHPATSDGDSVALLVHEGGGSYRGVTSEAPHQRARILVTDLAQSWALAGRMQADGPAPVEPGRP